MEEDIVWPEIQLGEYEHFKGKRCRVLGVSKHSETLEDYVVYQTIKTGRLWIRPLTMFFEEVERDGKRFPRFRYIGE